MKQTIILLIMMPMMLSACGTVPREKTIGAVIPLSGPAAIWGEQFQKGMELALERTDGFSLVVEDSMAKPAEGVKAFNKLRDVDEVEVVFSMFSSVSTPLVPLADSAEIPLVMSLVAANDITVESEFAWRYFNDAEEYAGLFFPIFVEKGYSNVGVIALNDEYGVSVVEAMRDHALDSGINLDVEYYEFADFDFRTELLKLNDVEALAIIGSAPNHVINSVRQAEELGITADIFDVSVVLSEEVFRKSLGGAVNGVHTLAYSFTLGETGQDFSTLYQKKYGEKALNTAAAGYDLVRLVSSFDDVQEGLQSVGRVDTLYGSILVETNGEMNPTLYPVRIENGELVR